MPRSTLRLRLGSAFNLIALFVLVIGPRSFIDCIPDIPSSYGTSRSTRPMPNWMMTHPKFHQLNNLASITKGAAMVTDRVMVGIEDPSQLSLLEQLPLAGNERLHSIIADRRTSLAASSDTRRSIYQAVLSTSARLNGTSTGTSSMRQLRDSNAMCLAAKHRPCIEDDLTLQPSAVAAANNTRFLHRFQSAITTYDSIPERLVQTILASILIILIDPEADEHLQLLLRLAQLPGVRYIEMDQPVYAANYETVGRDLWNLDVISNRRDFTLTGQYWYAFTGRNVRVHILDTGVNVEHEEFEGRAQVHYVDPLMVEPLCRPGWDCHGHGTHVAGLVAGRLHGVAKAALIFSSPVLYSKGSGEMSTIIKVLAAIIGDPIEAGSVVVMSLGGLRSGEGMAMHRTIAKATALGVTVVVAAGNNHQNACDYLPASSPDAITVGSHSSQGKRSQFSNYGKCVNIYAPGEGIRSAGIPHRNAYRVMSGTSMATPMVAGVVAQVLEQNPFITPPGIKQLLLNQAKTQLIEAGSDQEDMGDPRTAISSLVTAVNCIRRPSKICLFIKGRMFYRQAIKAPQLLTNRTCNVIEMISRGEQWSDMCRLTLTPPKDLLAFYRPLLSASFRTNQLRAWLYEDEALTRKPAARMELQIIEWRPVTTVNSSDSTNGTNCIIKKISSRSRSADYPQHVGVLFNKHSNYSAYIQWKQNQLLPSNLVEDGLPFVLFIELPSHCLMEHAQCVRGECDQQTGLCRCDQGFDGVTCSQPAQPANGRKPWPLFRSFPQWYYKSIFAVVVGVGLHGLLYLIAGHVWFRLTRWWRRRRSSVEFL